MPWYKWSRTANTNATADSTINWAEGQAPSSINDSARAMMAATAMYRDDIAGAIVTSGTSTAYTVSSFSVFDSLADMNGQMIAFTPHATNGATVTINVDGLGAKPLRSAPSTELLAGVLIQGTPYTATYNNSDGAWYLKGFYGNPYNVPLASGMDYWASTAPNSSFAFPAGQAISRTTYATLFAMIGTQYGTGDGSTTFNLPDKRGRVSAALDNLNGGTRANRLTSTTINNSGGGGGTGLGDNGGAQTNALSSTNQLPQFTPSGTVATNIPATLLGNTPYMFTLGGNPVGYGGSSTGASPLDVAGAALNSSFTGNAIGSASPSSFNIVMPTICCNYIMRVL
jgi:microcystin-dependent protein